MRNRYRVRKWGAKWPSWWDLSGQRPWCVYDDDGESVARFATWEEAVTSADRWCASTR